MESLRSNADSYDEAVEISAELPTLASDYLKTSFNLYHISPGHLLASLARTDQAGESYARVAELS